MLIILFTALVVYANAQDGINFKIKYLPNHTYQIAGNTTMDFMVDLSANKDIAAKLKAKGIEQPINMHVQFDNTGNISTGEVSAGVFLYTMSYDPPAVNVTINGKAIPIPLPAKTTKGGSMYGHVSSDGTLKMDSLKGSKLNDSTTAMVQKMTSTILKQIKFPDHPLKPGDTFTQDIPFDIPAAVGKNMAIDIKVTYKLANIADNQAFFDLVQDLNMNLQVKKIAVTLTGTGTGKLIYDIKNQYPVSLNNNMDMKINAKLDTLNVNAIAKISSNQTYVIGKTTH